MRWLNELRCRKRITKRIKQIGEAETGFRDSEFLERAAERANAQVFAAGRILLGPQGTEGAASICPKHFRNRLGSRRAEIMPLCVGRRFGVFLPRPWPGGRARRGSPCFSVRVAEPQGVLCFACRMSFSRSAWKIALSRNP